MADRLRLCSGLGEAAEGAGICNGPAVLSLFRRTGWPNLLEVEDWKVARPMSNRKCALEDSITRGHASGICGATRQVG